MEDSDSKKRYSELAAEENELEYIIKRREFKNLSHYLLELAYHFDFSAFKITAIEDWWEQVYTDSGIDGLKDELTYQAIKFHMIGNEDVVVLKDCSVCCHIKSMK